MTEINQNEHALCVAFADQLQVKLAEQQATIKTLKTNFQTLLKRSDCWRCDTRYMVYESDFQCTQHLNLCDNCHAICFGAVYGETVSTDAHPEGEMVLFSANPHGSNLDPHCVWIDHSAWKMECGW